MSQLFDELIYQIRQLFEYCIGLLELKKWYSFFARFKNLCNDGSKFDSSKRRFAYINKFK